MKISDIEYQGDASKATFYYTAEERVDFRELIKLFAREFRTRIEMKQVGFQTRSSSTWRYWFLWKRIMLFYLAYRF